MKSTFSRRGFARVDTIATAVSLRPHLSGAPLNNLSASVDAPEIKLNYNILRLQSSQLHVRTNPYR